MPVFRKTRLADSPPVRPRSWARRTPLAVALPIAALLAASTPVVIDLFKDCGAGLTSVGSPYVCVGLNIDSGPMRAEDPLADLEKIIADHNARVTGDFKTIVVLENLTVTENDSNPVSFVRHEVQGAIAAALRKDAPTQIKLLLANFGSNADHWQKTVDAIVEAAPGQRIVAVTDVGLSQENSRAAVAELSKHGIATIGATVTADNMNLDTAGVRVKNFFRVGPTNTDEAHVAAKYIARQRFQRVMLVMDTSEADTYATTLAKAFQEQIQVSLTKKFDFPQLTTVSRDGYMRKVFAGMHSDICAARPDLIYFAGRGSDLGSFLSALANDGACELASVTVLSGDDASTLAGRELREAGDIHFQVMYTALAHPSQWEPVKDDPVLKTHRRNYDDFLTRFLETGTFSIEDLKDGAAMIQHDAVTAAATAALNDPTTEPRSIVNFIKNIDCTSPVPGASGFIAFDEATGNQVNKPVPIVRINGGGSISLVDLDWSQARPKETACP